MKKTTQETGDSSHKRDGAGPSGNERNLWPLIEAVQDIYYRTDMAGVLLDISSACEVKTGYRAQEIIGRNVNQFYADPGDRDEMLALLESRGRVEDYSARLVHRDGSIRYASVSCCVVTDSDGKPVAVEGLLRDITERSLRERHLANSEAFMQTLFQSASDYALLLEIVDGRPMIVDINDAAFEQFGYSREEMIGQPVSRFETETSASQIPNRSMAVDNENPAHFDVEHVRRDGTTFIGRVSAKMVPGSSGRKLVFAVGQDISDLKRVEDAQKRLLAENRLLTQNMMRLQEEERRCLARDLHDELGQLLTSIDANASYLARYVEQGDLQNTAREIIRDTQTAFDASHKVLFRLRPATLDTLGVEAALRELVENWDSKRGIDCLLEVDGELELLDEYRAIAVYRLIQEGVTNAVRHGKAGRIRVRTQVIHDHDGHDALQVEIDDNGKGAYTESLATGMGIIGMRERVYALGGLFMITNMPEGGVRIEAIIPLRDESDA